ncbi:MAG: prolyl oligopeptidase family serine peptidase [Candidatus Thorarchaeota archaeon]
MEKIFYVNSSRLEEIRAKPSNAYAFFPATKVDLWEIPELQNDLENQWEVVFIPFYSSRFFCVVLRINQTDMKSRDRAYQHGGGFVFQLVEPRKNDELSDIFTVFGTCPLEEREELQWSRFFVYYKDIDLVFKKIDDAVIEVEIDDGYTYMLAMAPWQYADPLGPFLTKRIGFNIIVPQPIEAEYPVQYYSLISGWKIMAEQELRDYVVYNLENPQTPIEGFEIECSLKSKHYSKGERGFVQCGVNSPSDVELEASMVTDGKTLVCKKVGLSKGLNYVEIEFDTTVLDTGRNCLEVCLGEESIRLEVLIFDSERISLIEAKVCELSKNSTDNLEMKESLVTIEWMLESLNNEIESLKPHQSPWHIQELIEKLETAMKQVESGKSLFGKGEQLRMGLRSKQDDTLQPYSIYIPPTYDRGKSGLIVVLHGSGTNDERSLKNAGPLDKFDRTKMIVVAPLARGESHSYLPEESVQEIIEITEKMMKLFSIPQEKVVISGFSMGGFGVLKAFHKRPDLYRNLMIISGSMKAYNRSEVVQDLATEDSLKKIAQTNLIIFHGADDLNVSYSELKPVHDRLLELNPEIEIHIAEGFGHQQPPDWEKKMMRFFELIDRSS